MAVFHKSKSLKELIFHVDIRDKRLDLLNPEEKGLKILFALGLFVVWDFGGFGCLVFFDTTILYLY